MTPFGIIGSKPRHTAIYIAFFYTRKVSSELHGSVINEERRNVTLDRNLFIHKTDLLGRKRMPKGQVSRFVSY